MVWYGYRESGVGKVFETMDHAREELPVESLRFFSVAFSKILQIIKRPKNGDALCRSCFTLKFEQEIHETIVSNNLFKPNEKIAIGASGGKDSTVLAHVLKVLNERHSYNLILMLLSVDEGISGYRNDSLEAVKRNRIEYSLPLEIVSYEDLYDGWTMDKIVAKIGRKNNCTFCGVFRRQALDRGAVKLKVDKIATGHNADDIAETVLMNVLRGDVARLQRCTAIITDTEGMIPRCKPLKYAFEKEIVLYAHFNKLDYFSTECIYSPFAFRGHARTYIKDLERVRPRAILDLITSGEALSAKEGVKLPQQGTCNKCGYISSMPICKACVLLHGLNTDQPTLGIKKTSKQGTSLTSLSTATSCASLSSQKSVNKPCACATQHSNLNF